MKRANDRLLLTSLVFPTAAISCWSSAALKRLSSSTSMYVPSLPPSLHPSLPSPPCPPVTSTHLISSSLVSTRPFTSPAPSEGHRFGL